MIIAPSDISRTQLLLLTSARLSQRLDVAAEEVATGLRLDPLKDSDGDATYLFELKANAARITADLSILELQQGRADAATTTLTQIIDVVSPIGADLLSATELSDDIRADRIAEQGREALSLLMASLNTSYGGRAVFGGTSPGGPLTQPLETLLTDLKTELSANPAVDATVTIASFFAAGGGFDTGIWLGGERQSAISLSSGHIIGSLPTGREEAFRETMAALSMIYLSTDLSAFPTAEARQNLRSVGADRLMSGQTGLTMVAAEIGAQQERLKTLTDLLDVEATATNLALSDVLSADPYAAAARLSEAQAQLEALFTITGRITSLSLARFL